MSEDLRSPLISLRYELTAPRSRRSARTRDQFLDVIMVGDQRGQGLIAVQVTAKGRNRQPQSRVRCGRGLLHIAARGDGRSLDGDQSCGCRQEKEGKNETVFHGMDGLLLPLAVLAAGSNVAGRRDAKWRSTRGKLPCRQSSPVCGRNC